MNLIKPATVFSILQDVNACEMVFRYDPIWPPCMRKSVSRTGENADFKTCKQRFCKVIVFRSDPIWPTDMGKSVSTKGENADLRFCRQMF